MRRKQLTDVMSIRLPAGIRAELEAEADYRKTSVAEVIRERLDSATATLTIVKQLRAEMVYVLGKFLGGPLAPKRLANAEALQAEVLMLLRQIVSPGQMRNAQNVVHSLGLEIWTGEDVQ